MSLPKLFKKVGMKKITVTPQHEKVTRNDEGFQLNVNIWADVLASRGLQMVKDGYITDTERTITEKDYRDWVEKSAKSQTMYLLAIEGIRLSY